ncbi:MAG: methyltransferase domain-containing protein, partial [Pseudomonadota bacterium]
MKSNEEYEIVLQHFRAGKSLWRSWMNAHLSGLNLVSPVLDMGAGAEGTASYHGLIAFRKGAHFYSVDICSEKSPSLVADLEKGIPVKDSSLGTCLAFNLFEHVFSYQKLFGEIYRVLKTGGKLFITVPFLVRVHADPSDYFRYTGSGIERALSDAGFSMISVFACGSGAVSAALGQVDFLVPKPLRGFFLRAAFHLDRLISMRSGGKYRNA